MTDKKGVDFFIEQVPSLKKWQIAVPTYVLQLLFFIALMFFFYKISQTVLVGAIIGQCIIAFLGTLPYRYIVRNSRKIRKKYLEEYKEFAGQKFWFHFQSYTVPLLSSSLYFSLLLKTDYFLPSIVKLPEHFVTKTIFPVYIAVPLAVLFCILGLVIRRPSGGFAEDVEAYFYVLYPEKGVLITEGRYSYCRNPRYLGRGFLAVGFGIFSNNILAIIVGFIHFVAFASLIPSEAKELQQRFGKDFEDYKKRVPALFPKLRDWGKFLKSVYR